MDYLSSLAAERCAAYFRVLGDATRLRLLQALSDGNPRTVGNLAGIVRTTVPNASKHLLALAQHGVLHRERVGTCVLYRLADPATLDLVAGAWAALDRALAAERRALEGVEHSLSSPPEPGSRS